MARLSDDWILFILFAFIIFVMVSGASNSAVTGALIPDPMFYLALLIIHAVLITRDKRVSIQFENNNNPRMQSLMIAIAGYGAFIFLTPIIAGLFLVANNLTPTMLMSEPGLINSAASQVQLLGQETITIANAIRDSPYFAMIIVAIFGVIETLLFFGSGLEFLRDRVDKRWAWAIVILAFSGFHIFVKNVIAKNGLNVGLISTLSFAIISLIIVEMTDQIIEASELHAGTNAIAAFLQLKQKGII